MIRLYYLSNTYRATVTEVESLDFIKTENLKEQILELFQNVTDLIGVNLATTTEIKNADAAGS